MNARWIAPKSYDGNGNYYFYARKMVNLQQLPPSATIKISADSHYRLLVNGLAVITGPVRGTCSLHYYDETDIARYLHTGGNELLIEVYTLGEENFTVSSTTAAVIAELENITATDETWEVAATQSWARKVPYYTTQIGRMECRDLRVKPDPWQKAALVTDPRLLAKKLLKNTLPAMRENVRLVADVPVIGEIGNTSPDDPALIPAFVDGEKLSPVDGRRLQNIAALMSAEDECVIAPNGKGVRLVCDFDYEVSGRLAAVVDAPAGTVVEVVYGEVLKGDRIASMFQSNVTYHFTDRYTLAEGKNQIGTTLFERGFRMVQLTIRNFDRPVKISQIRGIDRRYPFAKRGSFFASDYRLNRIFEVCQETLSACASDAFTDCPWRERGFWVNDLIVNNRANLISFGTEEIHRRCFELAFSQTDDQHLIPAVCPAPPVDGAFDFIFAPTNLFMMLMLQDYWMFSGDEKTVRKYLPNIEQILNSLWKLADDKGMLTTRERTARWHFYDWCFELNGYTFNGGMKESMLNSLYIIAAKLFVDAAQKLDYKTDIKEIRRRRQLIAANLEAVFVDPASGLLTDQITHKGKVTTVQSQLAHALWLLTGEASEERKARFVEALTLDSCLMPEYYLHHFWFQAAREQGLQKVGLERIRKYWSNSTDSGSPTLFEAGIHKIGREAMGECGSLCHGFGTIPVDFMTSEILGVTPLTPGFANFAFEPELFDLKFARGRIPTPHGNINVELELGKAVLTVPAGTLAVLPDGSRLGAGVHALELPLKTKGESKRQAYAAFAATL